jgi:hypothetical protein
MKLTSETPVVTRRWLARFTWRDKVVLAVFTLLAFSAAMNMDRQSMKEHTASTMAVMLAYFVALSFWYAVARFVFVLAVAGFRSVPWDRRLR